ncbi:MAG: SAF domain-containing protein [Solirubrobacterales bacterium]
MSRRVRALAFGLAATLAAIAAAAIADRYGSRVAGGYGQLRPVLVATDGLRRGRPIDRRVAARDLGVRRVPVRFAPPGALADPGEAIGLVPLAPVPAGAYLLAEQLRPPGSAAPEPDLGDGRRPVEIEVSGAAALAVGGRPAAGGRVDVVVTAEPGGSGRGRAYVAAAGVPLLALAPGPEGAATTAAATLGLTRREALRLIAAQSFARRVTILPEG